MDSHSPQLMTFQQFEAAGQISRRKHMYLRSAGLTPRTIHLPGRVLRYAVSDVIAYFDQHKEQ